MLGATAIPGVSYKSHKGVQNQQMQGYENSSSSRRATMRRDFYREESYMLLLELSSQEPTLQSCFKVIESTCLARGIGVKIRGKNASTDFQQFIDRYYLPFAENAIRHLFTLGFVPWRLRRISTGDSVPEVIPLGMFTWSIDSIPDRLSSRRTRHGNSFHRNYSLEQDAAERAFQKQKQYFAKGNRFMPYTIPEDNFGRKDAEIDDGETGAEKVGKKQLHEQRKHPHFSPAYYRQQNALRRQQQVMQPSAVPDDDETKLLRYQISFTESCGIMEEEVEIYEFMQPTNSVTRSSVLYGCVPSPLAHILVDYRNMRQAQMRQAHADAFNTQVCSDLC